MSSLTGSGFFIATDEDQQQQGYYKVSKTANITTTLAALNASRALRDFRIVKFFPCSDIKKLEDFVKSAMKTKYIPNSTEWVKVDEKGLIKVETVIETLCDIVNDSS